MDSRQHEIADWAAQCLQLAQRPVLEPVSGDASFRRYFRVRKDGNSWVLMDAPPESEDCAPFIDVTARLRAAAIHAPEITHQDIERGYLLLEDLGDRLYRDLLNPVSAEQFFPGIFAVLERMAGQVDSQGLPLYDEALLQRELDLFPDWFLQRHLERPWSEAEAGLWRQLCAELIDSARQQPQVFVHRDFHSCNLLDIGQGQPAVIDYQDAVYGPISYDLASLLWDRYITWPRERIEEWMDELHRRLQPDLSQAQWRQCCDWMGLQRNLKIVGIFSRLFYRDGKAGYLDMIPQFSGYILDVIRRYPQLEPYCPLLESRLCVP